eukprot:13974084-Ditylum_brightwellii.AAC.1
MTKETRRIVGKWYKLGKWVFYPAKLVCKTQQLSMLSAGVTHKLEFVNYVMDIFLKTDWSDKQKWSKEKLWTGGLTIFQLGKTALAALRHAHNMCKIWILAMVDMFLTLPKD